MDKSYSVFKDSQLDVRLPKSRRAIRIFKEKQNRIKIIEEALEREYKSSRSSQLQLPTIHVNAPVTIPAPAPTSRLQLEVSQHTVVQAKIEDRDASGSSSTEPFSGGDTALRQGAAGDTIDEATEGMTTKGPTIVFADVTQSEASDVRSVTQRTKEEQISFLQRQRADDEILRIPSPRDAERGRQPEQMIKDEEMEISVTASGGRRPAVAIEEPGRPKLQGAPSTPEEGSSNTQASRGWRIGNKLASTWGARARARRAKRWKSNDELLAEARKAKARSRRDKETKSADELLAEARISMQVMGLSPQSSDVAYTDILLSRSRVLNLPEKLTEDVLRGLVYPLTTIHGRQRLVVNLAQLQQLNLQQLRAELAQEVSALVGSGSMNGRDSDRIRELMGEYCNTLRDWDYMSEKHSPEIENDPFKLVSSQTRDACIMEDADLFSKAASLWGAEYDPVRKQRVPNDFEAPALVGGSRGSIKEKKEAELFALRLWFSLLGGLALIAPMLFMVLYKGGENASLIITSVSTILFAVAMAKFSTQPPWNLVATTAAYAAVLVVFVGSSSAPSAA